MRPTPSRLLDYREYPVLYVDDEPESLRIFELTFQQDFTILTAGSAREGLALMAQYPVAVVLSDHKMPEVEGVEFLREVRELDGQTLRILVTAYGSTKVLSSAVNGGHIDRYIAKPWEPEEMRLIVQRSIEVYAMQAERMAMLDELMILNRLSRRFHRDINRSDLAEWMLRSLREELGYNGVSLLLRESSSDRLRFWASEPNDDVASRLREIEFDPQFAPRFLEMLYKGESQTLLGEEAADHEMPVRAWLTEVSAEEIYVVPLAGKKGIVGALAIDNRSGANGLGVDGRMLAEGLATQAVIALENSQLVDDLRKSQAQVQRVDRLGTLGTLAAGLAHEINNPLVSLNTFVRLAPEKREIDDPDFWVEYHELACGELDRIGGLVETMSRLGRSGTAASPEREIVDLAELAGQVARLLGRETERAAVALCLRVAEGLPKVEGVRDQLHQVLLNLALNAIQASPPGREIDISIEADDSARESPGVRICFRDSGEGVSGENLERIFDPFFTTKDPDKGTGLGLMISHQIVVDHGGSIEVESRSGEGATFHVRLPSKGLASAAEE